MNDQEIAERFLTEVSESKRKVQPNGDFFDSPKFKYALANNGEWQYTLGFDVIDESWFIENVKIWVMIHGGNIETYSPEHIAGVAMAIIRKGD